MFLPATPSLKVRVAISSVTLTPSASEKALIETGASIWTSLLGSTVIGVAGPRPRRCGPLPASRPPRPPPGPRPRPTLVTRVAVRCWVLFSAARRRSRPALPVAGALRRLASRMVSGFSSMRPTTWALAFGISSFFTCGASASASSAWAPWAVASAGAGTAAGGTEASAAAGVSTAGASAGTGSGAGAGSILVGVAGAGVGRGAISASASASVSAAAGLASGSGSVAGSVGSVATGSSAAGSGSAVSSFLRRGTGFGSCFLAGSTSVASAAAGAGLLTVPAPGTSFFFGAGSASSSAPAASATLPGSAFLRGVAVFVSSAAPPRW